MTVLVMAGAFCFGMICLLYGMYRFINAATSALDELDDKDWTP